MLMEQFNITVRNLYRKTELLLDIKQRTQKQQSTDQYLYFGEYSYHRFDDTWLVSLH